MSESFQFMLRGSGETTQEAWDGFYQDADHHFKWVKGYKVWRAKPVLRSEHEFDTDVANYVVTARVIACTNLPKGCEKAIVRGPYPNDPEPKFEQIMGLAI